MAFSMLQLFLLGALGPRLVDDLDVSPTTLGLTTTIGFGTAAVLSPVGGRVVDRVGPRRALAALLLLSAVALALIGAAPGAGFLLAAVALGGLPQALANPATNKAILASVEPARRGAVTGMKQSGVQLGAFAAGLPLAGLAGWLGWRAAVWTAAGAAVLTAAWALRALPATAPGGGGPRRSAGPAPAGPAAGGPQRPAGAAPSQAAGAAPSLAGEAAPPRTGEAAPPRTGGAESPRTGGAASAQPGGAIAWLAAFSLLLGCGIASVNTYLALYGADRLDLPPAAAAALVAVLGVAGIGGRVAWSRAATPGRAPWLPGWLAAGAVGAALLLLAAAAVGPLVWLAAVAVGVFAVSANAVSMVLVMQRAAPGRAGQDSALVSAGFFAGFALGPPLFGVLADAGRYGWGWALVAAEFAGACAVGLTWAVRERGARRRAGEA
ncbi:MFS transporter [Streptomyces sp. AN091965]|uniref:MFS transporter n=1 Tax=Streptomyces sp. AN091965 TaxID=2927803 RepID=UPI001F60783E|nr:MFS transporter [Streptomyces sp. AN091965]MCI3933584.1 MFS transporter [Streptomyces sp. AN091965]